MNRLTLIQLAREHVIRIRNIDSENEKPHNTIIQSLLDSDLPLSEKTTFRLTKESFTIVAAGGDTTGSTISSLLYHLVANPSKLARLRTDLGPLYSNPLHKPSWTQLEDIPYMMGTVKEGLRMNMGVTSRVSRCAPDRSTQYNGILIPRGTPVSMSIPDIHENADIFPEPNTFMPERWLSDDGKRSSNKLDRWLCSFSKGTRQCLGMK
jgi:cytochrome P450